MDRDELFSLLSELESDLTGAKIEKSKSSGLAMDANTVNLILDILEKSLPIAVGLIGTVWKKYKMKKEKGKTLDKSSKGRIVVETDDKSYVIELGELTDAKNIKIKLPSSDDVSGIRLE